MPESPRPDELRLGDAGELLILWDDGVRTSVSPRKLREACPCASCREKKETSEDAAKPKMLPVLKAEETLPLRIASLRPVGSYAYGIAFTDGHRSGLYSLELLRAISSPSTPPPGPQG